MHGRTSQRISHGYHKIFHGIYHAISVRSTCSQIYLFNQLLSSRYIENISAKKKYLCTTRINSHWVQVLNKKDVTKKDPLATSGISSFQINKQANTCRSSLYVSREHPLRCSSRNHEHNYLFRRDGILWYHSLLISGRNSNGRPLQFYFLHK
jgi:hypothetical protein